MPGRVRVGSKINSHFVCKMSGLFGTFANKLCEIIFERFLGAENCVLQSMSAAK